MTALVGLIRKEVYHILRDRRTLVVIVALPIVQVILFGYAIRTDVDRVRLAVVDPSPDAATLALRARFDAAGLFRTVAVLPTADSLDTWFRRDEAQGAVVFEPQFAEHLGHGIPAQLLVVSDATEPNTGSIVQAYVAQVVGEYTERVVGSGFRVPGSGVPGSGVPGSGVPGSGVPGSGVLGSSGSGSRGAAIVPTLRMRFNPTRESSNLFVPGLMAFVLTIVSSLMTAISLTREKETGTMEALLVSPLRPSQIIAGKVAPYIVVGFISVAGVLAEARLVFHVPLRGSLLLLLAEGALFILVSLALGILISARTSSQRVAMMGALIGTMLPTMLLSGFIFPIESMPAALRAISYIVPARWFVLVARSVMLKGVGLTYLWQPTLVLAAMAAILLAASTRAFHARLES